MQLPSACIVIYVSIETFLISSSFRPDGRILNPFNFNLEIHLDYVNLQPCLKFFISLIGIYKLKHVPMIEKKEILEEMNNRSREVFRRVVEGYLTDGEPVGSRTLSREFSEDISAATIRNVMQDLEFLGLLGSPHTSAGRIPTQLGLRMFVDGILEVSEVDKNDRKKIDKIVSDETNQVEDILDDISTTLSGVTQGASLVLTPKREAPIKHVEFLPLSISQAPVSYTHLTLPTICSV